MHLNETMPAETFNGRLTEMDGYFGLDDLGSARAMLQAMQPGPIVLLGAPGVGKGTQAEALASLWNIPTISTGEILRANVKSATALGIRANEEMMRGQLVPDHLITEMVARRLSLPDAVSGFILDGFPRTIQQAQWLDGYLAVHHGNAPLVIINMYMDPEKIVERIIHRRVCPCCDMVYSELSKRPKREGRCDNDNTVLIQRSDDRLEVFQERLGVFTQRTAPLIEHYQHYAQYIVTNADRPASVVTRSIVAEITGRRRLMNRTHHAAANAQRQPMGPAS
jgi:adenylate kinase